MEVETVQYLTKKNNDEVKAKKPSLKNNKVKNSEDMWGTRDQKVLERGVCTYDDI